MKNPELFHKTVGILVKAYMNGTLEHENCHACAVGNLVASNMGINIDGVYWSESLPRWNNVHMCSISGENTVHEHYYRESAKEQIDSTGYTWKETAAIEIAFERCGWRDASTKDEQQYIGLMSVLDCLQKIHECTEEETQESKELFVKS